MFDFDREMNRSGTMSLKWDKYKGSGCPAHVGRRHRLRLSPAVLEALTKRVAHGIFGYSRPSPRLIELIVSRLASRYGWTIQPEWLVFLPGVVPASISPARPGASTGAASSPQAGLLPFLQAPGFK